MFGGGADLGLADQLAAPIDVGGELASEMGLAVLLRPGGVQVLLAALGGLPADGHGVLLDQPLLLLGVLLDRRGGGAGVDDLPAAKSTCLSNSCSTPPSLSSLASRSPAANRLSLSAAVQMGAEGVPNYLMGQVFRGSH